MSARINTIIVVTTSLVLAAPAVLFAWTGPSAAPPSSNTLAPINIGTSDQVKDGGLSLNSLAIFGNTLLSGTTNYLNFGTVAGTSGYGLRNNSGIVEFKNSGGSWTSMASLYGVGGSGTTNYIPKFTAASTIGNSLIYDSGTNVGIGTALPTQRLDVQGGAIRQNINTTYDVWYQGGASTAGGDARNLAVLGTDEDSGDMLYVNYAGEYGAGTTLGGNVYAAGYFHTSDARMKHDIRAMNGLDMISLLRGVRFKWNKDNSAAVGVIAQEVEAVLPEAVRTDGEGMKSVDYAQLIAPLIEAVKEQQTQIDSLKHEIEVLKASN